MSQTQYRISQLAFFLPWQQWWLYGKKRTFALAMANFAVWILEYEYFFKKMVIQEVMIHKVKLGPF